MSKSRRERDLLNQSLRPPGRAPTRFNWLVPTSPIKLRITSHAILRDDPLADGRRFNPDPIRIRGVVRPASSRIVIPGRSPGFHHLGFARPNEVAICARRKRRRQVLHALQVTGRRGPGKGKPRKTNFWSRVKC